MKRIIDGATYNTDTATVIATGIHEDEFSRTLTETVLYQSRTGIYFAVDKVTTTRRRRDGEDDDRISHEWEVVGDARKANEYCEKYSLTILRDIEDMPPEAAPGEKLATVYLRVTPTLKADLDEASSEDKISGNLWATRCLEKCLSQRNGVGLRDLAEMIEISSTFNVHHDGEWSRELCIGALRDINDRAFRLAETLMGNSSAAADLIAGHSNDLGVQELRRRYQPYVG